MDHGQWPVNGRVQFSIYDFLLNERDPSFPLELYVAAMSSGTEAFADRIERERKTVEAMLIDHLFDHVLDQCWTTCLTIYLTIYFDQCLTTHRLTWEAELRPGVMGRKRSRARKQLSCTTDCILCSIYIHIYNIQIIYNIYII